LRIFTYINIVSGVDHVGFGERDVLLLAELDHSLVHPAAGVWGVRDWGLQGYLT
jgi:hypothetical protein